MRNLTAVNKPIVHQSLSHWGMFVGELHHESHFIVTGMDEYMQKIEEQMKMPVYHYRPMKSEDL